MMILVGYAEVSGGYEKIERTYVEPNNSEK